METSERPSWHDRSVLRSAQRAASLPRWARGLWYAVLGAFVASYVWDGAALWGVDRAAAHGELVKALLFGLAAFLAVELDAALRLLARLGLAERAGERRAPSAVAQEGAGVPGRLGEAEARRLARAPAYAEQLERIRWLHPLLTAAAVAAAAAALAWVDVPRPLDLAVAGLAGVSVAAALAVAALRGWVRLAVALAQGGGASGEEARAQA